MTLTLTILLITICLDIVNEIFKMIGLGGASGLGLRHIKLDVSPGCTFIHNVHVLEICIF